MVTAAESTTTLQWLDDEHSIILVQHIGDYTSDLVIHKIKEANAMINTVNHKVVVIQDFRKAGKLVDSMVGRLPHPRTVTPIIVGARGLMLFMAQLYSRIFRTIHLFDTVDEAVNFVRATR